MKKLICNPDKINDSEVTEIVKRVKLLLINSDNDILLGHTRENYQFPGGHVDEGEQLLDTLNREIKEEVGIDLNIHNINPFACAINYYKDYPKEGNNRKNEIYYYLYKSDLKPDLNHTNYTDDELKGNFTLKYVPFNQLIPFLEDNAKKYGDEFGIAKEMIKMLNLCNDDIKALMK